MAVDVLAVLQVVLSQTCDVICSIHKQSREDVFHKTEEFIAKNSSEWRSASPEINYGDPFCRMAYLYMNVPVHSLLVEKSFTDFDHLGNSIKKKILAGEEIRICALGGGPGSELLGLVRFIEGLSLPRKAYIEIVLVDLVKEWDESWHSLRRGIEQQLRESYGIDRDRWPISISSSFLPLDVTEASDFKNLATRFNGIDIFIFSYVVSEVLGSVLRLMEVTRYLVSCANPDALLLFLDRSQDKVRQAIDQIVGDISDLTMIDSVNDFGKSNLDLPKLGEWYIHIPSLPRQKWLTYFALAVKESA